MNKLSPNIKLDSSVSFDLNLDNVPEFNLKFTPVSPKTSSTNHKTSSNHLKHKNNIELF